MKAQKNIEKLRNAIIKAVPDIEVRNTSVLIPEPFGGLINHRDDTIRLADVLIALEGVRKLCDERFYVSSKGYLEQIEMSSANCIRQIIWDLTKNLDEQSPETKKLLKDLLI